MGLVDVVLEAEAKSRRGPACAVGNLVVSHDHGDELVEALELCLEGRVKWSTLANQLGEAWDVKIPASTLSRHARGVCSCDVG